MIGWIGCLGRVLGYSSLLWEIFVDNLNVDLPRDAIS